MTQTSIKHKQIFGRVLSIVDDFIDAKQKYQLLRSWISIKNLGVLKNVKQFQYSNVDNSRTLSLNGSSDYGDSAIINVPICDSKLASKQGSPVNQQKKQSQQNTQFEDKIIEKLFYLESVVQQMKLSLQRKQFELQNLKQNINNNFPRINDDNMRPNQSLMRYQCNSPSNKQYSSYDNLQKDSIISSAYNKTQILGKMFDNENESVKNMIDAIRQRKPSIIQDKNRQRCRSPINSQGQFQSYQNFTNQRFNSLDDAFSAPRLINEQNSFSSNNLLKYKQQNFINTQSVLQLSKQGYKGPKFSIQIKNSQNFYVLENISLAKSQNQFKNNMTPKPNFARRKQCGQFEAEKSPELNVSQHPKTQRIVKNRISAIN